MSWLELLLVARAIHQLGRGTAARSTIIIKFHSLMRLFLPPLTPMRTIVALQTLKTSLSTTFSSISNKALRSYLLRSLWFSHSITCLLKETCSTNRVEACSQQEIQLVVLLLKCILITNNSRCTRCPLPSRVYLWPQRMPTLVNSSTLRSFYSTISSSRSLPPW